ncbi:MAG: PAS domain S-box protein [bacterium]|nr:PAS domain S-box protein [bacterium]
MYTAKLNHRHNQMTAINALIVGINSEYAAELRNLLSRHPECEYHLTVAASFDGAIQSMAQHSPDVVLVGSSVDMKGYRHFIQSVQQQSCVQPVIILETSTDNPAEFDYLENGADFYLKRWRHETGMLHKAVMAGIERVKAFQAIRNSERRMRGIYYWSSIGILLVDLNGLIVQNNPAFSRIVGFSDDELCDMPLARDLVHPDDQEEVSRSFESVKTEQQPVAKLQCRMRTKEGDHTWTELTWSLFSETGSPAQFCVCLVEDITSKKNMESELRASEAQLKQLSAHLLDLIEQERRHIARELHDSIGSYLGAIKLGLGQLSYAPPTGKEQLSERLDQLSQMLVETMDELQRITTSLYPPVLDDLGIAAALRWHCGRVNSSVPAVSLTFQADIDESRIQPGLAIVMYRVSQEAIHNALQHSKSTTVAVSLSEEENTIVLRIVDKGVGLPGEMPGCNETVCGMGIRNMMKRVELSGGVFSISSAKDKGTAVSASWPVFRPSESPDPA